MKTSIKLVLALLFVANYSFGQEKLAEMNVTTEPMKTYVIERDIPNAGKLTETELKGISQTSCDVLEEMGSSNIQWLQSYVTDDKVFCIYKAVSKDAISEHAKKGGFPVTAIRELSTVISPLTAKQ